MFGAERNCRGVISKGLRVLGLALHPRKLGLYRITPLFLVILGETCSFSGGVLGVVRAALNHGRLTGSMVGECLVGSFVNRCRLMWVLASFGKNSGALGQDLLLHLVAVRRAAAYAKVSVLDDLEAEAWLDNASSLCL